MSSTRQVNLTIPDAYAEELMIQAKKAAKISQRRNAGSANHLAGAVVDCIRFALASPDFPKFVRCWRCPVLQDKLDHDFEKGLRLASVLLAEIRGEE